MFNPLISPSAAPSAASAAAPVASAGAAEASGATDAARTVPRFTRTVLDPAALAELATLDPRGEQRLLERVFGAYRNSAGRLMPQFHQARRDNDLETQFYVAHTLKSASAHVGGLKLSSLCAEIETMINGGETDALGPVADAMEAELRIVLQALTDLLGSRP